MLTRPLRHLRDNLVAYLALFVALGGTSYAALTISGGQIRNHSIDAVKLDPRSIAASIKAWANVQFVNGRLTAEASSSRVQVSGVPQSGESITWPHQRFGRNCMASVTPQRTGGSIANPLGAVTVDFRPTKGYLFVEGFGPDSTGRPQAAYVMIVCP
ncbi:MAG: hypothetical protein QOD66_2047 [Solirubrobacteraceae bacterium]|nr:hypothetical protein [Solirubrobacteraceae bacterium]